MQRCFLMYFFLTELHVAQAGFTLTVELILYQMTRHRNLVKRKNLSGCSGNPAVFHVLHPESP